jgi:putative alpha-1,2-mannosidase
MSGNDDAGQMSAWYIMSTIGFYQVCPGCGGYSEYVLGLPMFSHIEINLPPVYGKRGIKVCEDVNTCDVSDKEGINKVLAIDAIFSNKSVVEFSDTKKFIQSVTWNGCDYDCAFFPHRMLMNGGHLVIHLGLEPNKSWGGDGRKCMDNFIYFGDRIHGRDSNQVQTCNL